MKEKKTMATTWKTVQFHLTGKVALICHNGRLADPLFSYTQEIHALAKQRNKSEATILKMRKLEFLGGLYLDEKQRPGIPGINIEAMLVAAFRSERKGKEAEKGVEVVDEFCLLEYDGPKTGPELWEITDTRGNKPFVLTCNVKLKKAASLMRTRPRFPKGWSLVANIRYNPAKVDESDLIKFMQLAGEDVGLGDWNPRFGRFDVEIIK